MGYPTIGYVCVLACSSAAVNVTCVLSACVFIYQVKCLTIVGLCNACICSSVGVYVLCMCSLISVCNVFLILRVCVCLLGEVFDSSSTPESSPTPRIHRRGDMVTPTRPRTTEDLFAAIHRYAMARSPPLGSSLNSPFIYSPYPSILLTQLSLSVSRSLSYSQHSHPSPILLNHHTAIWLSLTALSIFLSLSRIA